jgi:hypothetical protein
MNLKKKASLIIYRFQAKGLEIFLLNPEEEEDHWGFLQGTLEEPNPAKPADQGKFIELNPVVGENDQMEEAWAVEGDWHDIPSLKAMLCEDALQLKEKLQTMEIGAYLSLKEVLKKALPHQYQFIKELKDILMDRHSVTDL